MWKKCIVLLISIGFIVIYNLPTIKGNVLKSNNLENIITKYNDENINSYSRFFNIKEQPILEGYRYFLKDRFGNFKLVDNTKSLSLHFNKYYNTKNADPPNLNENDFTYLNPDKNYENSYNYKYARFKNLIRLNKASLTKKTDTFTSSKNIIIFYRIGSKNIFYVGGSGPNNYTSIQEAIDIASNGDTVFVYNDSSPYYENLIIDKSINLIGEDKESTIINGSKLDSLLDTLEITANNVFINGFSIVENLGYYYQAAIKIAGDYFTISNCKFYNNNWISISLQGSFYSQIIDCEIYNNLISIQLVDSNENQIMNCICYNNSDDILFFDNSHNNKIINCTCIGNGFSGIHIQRSSGNEIVNCTCINGNEGIGLAYAPNTKMRGNIINNNNENFGIGSTFISDFYCDIDTSNMINGKPIYYWIDYHDNKIPNDAGFIGLISCSNISVKNLQINKNFQGLVGAGVSNCTIENCNFGNNGGHGMFFVSSSENTIRNCTVNNNFFSGIYLISLSNNNIVQYNILSNIQNSGIWSEESPGNYIEGHIIKNCYKGISLDSSSNSVLRDNDMTNCGLAIDGSFLSDYVNDIDTSNTVNGKILYYYLNKTGIVAPNNAGQIILVNCSFCNITNLDLSSGTIGLELAFSSYNNIYDNIINNNRMVAIDLDCSSNNYNMIKGNTIMNNNYAIDVDFSCYNTIIDNIIYDNSVCLSFDFSDYNSIINNEIQNSWNGIYLSESDNNEISHNTVQNCGFNGIYLLYSKGNNLKGNKMVNCGLLVFGFSLSEYINDVDTSNTVNGKILYYYINKNGIVVPNDAGEVILINCNYCNVTNLDLSDGTIGLELAYSNQNTISKNKLNNNNFAGIYLESSDDNNVRKNTIDNNNYGITLQLANSNNIKRNEISLNSYGCYIYLSNSNTFYGNNIRYNTYGIYFNLPSDNNNIYYNNLINNGINAWDVNEKTNTWDNEEKGNYWADYEDKYPNAKKIWLKGIWSIPYDIPYKKNKDRFPLILPYIGSNEKAFNIIRINFFEKMIDYFHFLKQLI